MKRIKAIMLLLSAMVLLFCGCSNSDEQLSDNVSSELELAVSQAILCENKNSHYEGECSAEGHIIFGTREKDDTVYAYTYFSFANFGFENGNFVEVAGCQMPAVFEFSNDTYEFICAEYPDDGEGYSKSVEKMFPKKYEQRVLNISDAEYDELNAQLDRYAFDYLKSIGREAEIGRMRDYTYPLLTDMGVSVDVSNSLSKIEKTAPYPYWVGNREKIENGVRFVYQMDYDAEGKLIIYTKYEYNNTSNIKEKIVVNALNGRIVE